MKDRPYPTVHLHFRKRVAATKGQPIYLGQIVDMLTEPSLEQSLRRLIVSKPDELDGNLVLIDMLQVIRQIQTIVPAIQIEHYGEPHTLVEIVGTASRPNLLAVGLVWLVLFIGSGLTIINFHADVSMMSVHQRIYQLMTGKFVVHPYVLQIPYSIGIGVGMILFFNHIFKKKFNDEPSPLEVEMFLYQENMNHFVITEEYSKIRKKKERYPDEYGGD